MVYSSSTLTTEAEMLKVFYLPKYDTAINRATILWNKVNKRTDDVVGKSYTKIIQTNYNQGFGSRADGGAIPAAGQNEFANLVIPMRHHFGAIKITLGIIEASKKDAGAVVRALDAEMKGITETGKMNLARQTYGTSVGQLALLNGAALATATSIPFDNALGFRTLRKGMRIDICDTSAAVTSASAATTNNQEITAIAWNADGVSGTLTINASGLASNCADNAIIVLAGSLGIEMGGLYDTIDDDAGTLSGNTTYGGLTKTSYEFLSSTLVNVGGALSDLKLQEAYDGIDGVMNAEGINLVVCPISARTAYANSLTSAKKYVNTQVIKGGFSAIMWQGGAQEVALVADKYCTPNTAYMLDINDMDLLCLSSPSFKWMELDGAILSRNADGTAGYGATLYQMCNWMHVNLAHAARLYNIS